MKKIFSLLAVFAIAMTANAQLVQFGITGDVAFDKEAKVKSAKMEDFKPDMGWSAGVKVKLSTPLGIGADAALKFAQEDRAYTWFEDATEKEVSDKVSFLAIPINLRYELKLPIVDNAVLPYAFVGPEFRYSFSGFDWDNVKAANATEKFDDAKDYFKEQKMQWNLNLGIGVLLMKHVELSYTYSIGMTDALEQKSSNEVVNKVKTIKELNSRVKDKTSKIALTYYF